MAQLIHFDPAQGAPGQALRNDSAESLFFQRELEIILPEVLEQEKPRLNFLDYIPVKSNVPLGVQNITFRSMTSGGKAEFLGPKSGDLPTVNVGAEEDSVRYKMIGVCAVYSYEEMMAAQFAASQRGASVGANLERDLIRAGRRAIEELVNRVAWYGDASAKIKGLTQNPNILRSAAAYALSGSTTADQVLSVLNDGANAIQANTAEVESPNTLLLPPAAYRYAAQQQRSSASDTTTLKFWLDTNGDDANGIKAAHSVREMSEIQVLANGAASTTTGALFYEKDPMVLELPYSGIVVLPVQQSGLNYLVPMIAKVGEMIVRRPRAIHLVTGV